MKMMDETLGSIRMIAPALVLLSLFGVLVFGCGAYSVAVTYYTLNAAPPPDGAAGGPPPATGDLVLGIGPIHLPAYLDRLQMVSRIGANRLRVDDYHRWAAPLRQEVQRVLGENLRALTGIGHIVFHPWTRDQKPDVAVGLDVHAFEGRPNGDVIFRCTVMLSHGRNPSPKFLHRTIHVTGKMMAAGDYEATVAAQSSALIEMSRQLADEILNLIPR